MKKYTILAAAALLALSASADEMKITLTDGTTVSYDVDKVSEITFETATAETVAGAYTGTQAVNIGGTFNYSAEITVTVVENADGTLNVTYPQYSLAGTVMGDITLSELTIPNVPFDESKNAYYLDYSNLGLKQHFKAERNGVASMDNDYVLGATSTITLEKTDTGIKITNPFKLGAMPLPITATFTGDK